MKRILALLFFIIIINFPQQSIARETANINKLTTKDFSKSYKTSSENLLYLLLSAINAQNYSIEEIQFKTGSVLFKAYTKEFIASVATQDGNNAFIKIIPADNVYNFSPALLQKIHSYIELNDKTIFQKVL